MEGLGCEVKGIQVEAVFGTLKLKTWGSAARWGKSRGCLTP